MEDVKDLTLLGAKGTNYEFDGPNPDLLETFRNKYPHSKYVVTHTTDEFTSLCPVTHQPDFGQITIEYSPRDKCVEPKSLKMYLFSFRNSGAFMESIVNMIKEDLFNLMNPYWIHVTGEFKSRGGIHTKVVAHFNG